MLDTVLNVLYVAIPCVIAIVGLAVALVKAIKKFKTAKTDEEKASVLLELEDKAISVIETLEAQYANTAALKAAGLDTSVTKKESAMSKMLAICNSLGVAFDEDYWSERIETLVSLMNTNKAKTETTTEAATTTTNTL